MDAHIVAVHMYQRNALTLRELQSIQSQTDRPVEAADTLLNIIMEQRDAVYLDVLKHTGQQHIYQTLVEDGYKGGYSIIPCFIEFFFVFYKCQVRLNICMPKQKACLQKLGIPCPLLSLSSLLPLTTINHLKSHLEF